MKLNTISSVINYLNGKKKEFHLCLMKSGFPLHLKVKLFPSGISESLTSILANAKTSAEALIDCTNWVTTVLAP